MKPTPLEMLDKARAFAHPFVIHETLPSGENVWDHAQGVDDILCYMGGAAWLRAAAYLVYTVPHLAKPAEGLAKHFDPEWVNIALEAAQLIRVQAMTRQSGKAHIETVRKMLLAFSRDVRVILLRLASRLQTLRYAAATKRPPMEGVAKEALQVFAPLANRLGIWQIKWEMEDLAFRFTEPEAYQHIAKLLDEKRTERERHVENVRQTLQTALMDAVVSAKVVGRPKHIYSIAKKMRGKSLQFDRVFDLRALRVVVESIDDCYAALAVAHTLFVPIPEEYDDYIAKPKPNGYQSLHTVVRDETGAAFEIQIRTQAMHDLAENGVAAHWVYKEAGTKGYAGVSANSSYDGKIAILRQLLAWERDLSHQAGQGLLEDRIYVLTPKAQVIELPQHATPLDFAYHLHTQLGHRCRGAWINGHIVPLHTKLQNGQMVEIMAAKEGGPSRDWLGQNPIYLQSSRAKAKVRAWFHAQVIEQTRAKGRDLLDKFLAKEGKTAWAHEELAKHLECDDVPLLYERIGKEELSPRNLETLWRDPIPSSPNPHVGVLPFRQKVPQSGSTGKISNEVMVLGVGSLLTACAKCCNPTPPEAIAGFVARGKGVSIHRQTCTDFLHLQNKWPERVVQVRWVAES